MSTKLGKILADFTTSLATAMAVGATSATLQSATDDDGVALPTGTYYFALDGGTSNKEHIQCTLTGTALTAIQSVTRQGTLSSGVVRKHRVGCSVALTDFAYIMFMQDLLAGTTTLNASIPLGYDGTASITTANQLATKAYVDGVAVAGAPNADTTTKGIVEIATQAEVLAKTATGGTGASLSVRPDTLPSTLLSDYKADTGAANAYVITPAPALTAYVTGQMFTFKAANANTTTSTLNVNGLGAKTIKRMDNTNLSANDIITTQIVCVVYDGTNMVMVSPVANTVAFSAGAYPAGNGAAITGIHTDIQTFTSTGANTWTKPANALLVRVILYGGGGGGGTGGTTSGAGSGSGGGGGQMQEKFFNASDLGATVTVTVGTGGTATNTGGDTTFGSILTAKGGAGGVTNGTGGTGGGYGSSATAAGAQGATGGTLGNTGNSGDFGGGGGGGSQAAAGSSLNGGGGGGGAGAAAGAGSSGGGVNAFATGGGAGGGAAGNPGTVGSTGTNGTLGKGGTGGGGGGGATANPSTGGNGGPGGTHGGGGGGGGVGSSGGLAGTAGVGGTGGNGAGYVITFF